MTNKEAIQIIKSNWPPDQYSQLREALHLAIKSLGVEELELKDDDLSWCRTCKGKGFYFTLHSRETCSLCKGRGRIYGSNQDEVVKCSNGSEIHFKKLGTDVRLKGGC